MNIYRRWTLRVIGSLVVMLGIVVIINVIVDANGILKTEYSRQFQPPNMSFSKVNFLLKNRHRFDSFLFGSSRTAGIHVENISGGSYYNMFYAAGLPEEHLEHVRFLLKNGFTIRNIMIGLDEFSYLFDARQHLSELDLEPHPAISGKNLFTFYGEHFLKLNGLVPQLKAYIRYNYTEATSADKRKFVYDISGTGNVLCRDCDEEIERNVEDHIKSGKFLQPWDYRFVEGDFIAPTLDVMKQLVDLSRKNEFRLIVFIHPIHKVTYLNADLKKFAQFKKELAAITDYYDFSGLNTITTDNYYYYETSHYRPMVGDMMLRVMLGKPDVRVPPNFGFLVTRENIDRHLAEQCHELQRTTDTLKPVNAVFARSCPSLY